MELTPLSVSPTPALPEKQEQDTAIAGSIAWYGQLNKELLGILQVRKNAEPLAKMRGVKDRIEALLHDAQSEVVMNRLEETRKELEAFQVVLMANKRTTIDDRIKSGLDSTRKRRRTAKMKGGGEKLADYRDDDEQLRTFRRVNQVVEGLRKAVTSMPPGQALSVIKNHLDKASQTLPSGPEWALKEFFVAKGRAPDLSKRIQSAKTLEELEELKREITDLAEINEEFGRFHKEDLLREVGEKSEALQRTPISGEGALEEERGPKRREKPQKMLQQLMKAGALLVAVVLSDGRRSSAALRFEPHDPSAAQAEEEPENPFGSLEDELGRLQTRLQELIEESDRERQIHLSILLALDCEAFPASPEAKAIQQAAQQIQEEALGSLSEEWLQASFFSRVEQRLKAIEELSKPQQQRALQQLLIEIEVGEYREESLLERLKKAMKNAAQ